MPNPIHLQNEMFLNELLFEHNFQQYVRMYHTLFFVGQI